MLGIAGLDHRPGVSLDDRRPHWVVGSLANPGGRSLHDACAFPEDLLSCCSNVALAVQPKHAMCLGAERDIGELQAMNDHGTAFRLDALQPPERTGPGFLEAQILERMRAGWFERSSKSQSAPPRTQGTPHQI